MKHKWLIVGIMFVAAIVAVAVGHASRVEPCIDCNTTFELPHFDECQPSFCE